MSERRSGVYPYGMRMAARGAWIDINLTLGYMFDNAHTSLGDVAPYLVKGVAQVHTEGGRCSYRSGVLGLTLTKKTVTWEPPKRGRFRKFLYRKPRTLTADGFVLSEEGELVAYVDFGAVMTATEGTFTVVCADPVATLSEDILYILRNER